MDPSDIEGEKDILKRKEQEHILSETDISGESCEQRDIGRYSLKETYMTGCL